MNIKLIQKEFLKGTKEFEISDDVVNVRIKTLFKEKMLTVGLSTLNPEPYVNHPYLEFHERTKNKPLLSLLINKPTAQEFSAFVDALKQALMEESKLTSSTDTASSRSEGLASNSYEEPPEFKEFGHNRSSKNINANRIEESIQQLEMFIVAEEIKPLLSALEALKMDPQNDECFSQMEQAFNNLGIAQGAVLTYAPYISVLIADDPFDD